MTALILVPSCVGFKRCLRILMIDLGNVYLDHFRPKILGPFQLTLGSIVDYYRICHTIAIINAFNIGLMVLMDC